MHGIPAYQWEVRIELEHETDIPHNHVTVQELHHLSDDLIKINGEKFERALAQQTAQPVKHLDGPLLIFDDVHQGFPHHREIGSIRSF